MNRLNRILWLQTFDLYQDLFRWHNFFNQTELLLPDKLSSSSLPLSPTSNINSFHSKFESSIRTLLNRNYPYDHFSCYQCHPSNGQNIKQIFNIIELCLRLCLDLLAFRSFHKDLSSNFGVDDQDSLKKIFHELLTRIDQDQVVREVLSKKFYPVILYLVELHNNYSISNQSYDHLKNVHDDSILIDLIEKLLQRFTSDESFRLTYTYKLLKSTSIIELTQNQEPNSNSHESNHLELKTNSKNESDDSSVEIDNEYGDSSSTELDEEQMDFYGNNNDYDRKMTMTNGKTTSDQKLQDDDPDSPILQNIIKGPINGRIKISKGKQFPEQKRQRKLKTRSSKLTTSNNNGHTNIINAKKASKKSTKSQKTYNTRKTRKRILRKHKGLKCLYTPNFPDKNGHYQCINCHERFQTISGLCDHIRKNYMKQSCDKLVNDCLICMKSFEQNFQTFVKHMVEVHCLVPHLTREIKMVFQCKCGWQHTCHDIYDDDGSSYGIQMLQHMLDEHESDRKCVNCGTLFGATQALIRHIVWTDCCLNMDKSQFWSCPFENCLFDSEDRKNPYRMKWHIFRDHIIYNKNE